MNQTVLELGLKNRQLSTVKCFLTIQHQTFRLSLSHQNLDITAAERIGKDWDQVFHKLIAIISVTINDQTCKHFAQSLARIAFKTLSLLTVTISETKQLDDDFSPIRTHFYSVFTRNNRLLRNALKIDKTDRELDSKTDSIELSDDCERDDIIKRSISNNCMVLAQYSMKKHKNLNIEWNYIIEKVIQLYLSHLNAQNGDQTNSILNNLGLDLSDVMYKIYTFTTNTNYRKLISNNIHSNKILAHNLEKKHFLHIKNFVDNYDNLISLSVNWIISMQNDLQQRIFLWHQFQHNDENWFTLLDSRVACNYLIDKNDFNKLIYWMQNESSDSDVIAFPFNWSIEEDMIESIYNRASIYAKEILLNKLCENDATFCETESNDFQLNLHRIGRVDVFDQHSDSLDNVPFSQVMNACNSDDFAYKLIKHCIDFNLYDYLYHHLKNLSNFTLTPFNNLTKLLNSSLKLVNDSNDNILKFILESAQYIYDLQSPVTIKSLIDCGHIYLALIAISYDSFNYCDIRSDDINDSPDKVLTFNSISSDILKTRYPLLYQSFFRSHCEQLTVYTLLKDTVPFDISKMFCWQLFNNIQNRDDDMTSSSIVFTELPHFSHNKLANLYGLKANLNFIYFLNQGRVIEAYNKLMSNKKKLNAKYLEHACKRAALLSYNETTNQQLIVSCIVFQQLLMNDFSQTSLHLAIANNIMDYASEFLGLNVRHQHLELSRLLKRAHYYKDKRASAKLLQLTNAALTRKYNNYNNMQIEECFDWKIPLKFVQFHGCDFPLDFLQKCAKADNWLMFTVFCQLHDCPKDQVIIALKHFSNQCISEHLIKAFQSSHSALYDNENGHSSRLLSKTEKQHKTSAKYLRNTLLSKLRIHRHSELDSTKNLVRNSFKTGSSSLENDDKSIASESEFNAVETISAFSSSSNDNNNDSEEALKFSVENVPKDFFQVILNYCNSDSTGDPIKSLYYLSIPLSNPILCLIASSINYQFKKLNHFNIFSCWLLASVDFDIRRQFCEQNTTYDALNFTLDDNYQMLDIVMRSVKSYIIFLRGIKIFSLSITPITDLLRFMISFFYEKNYFDVQNLKSFQDNLWKYQEPNKIDNYFYSKDWIQRASVIILTSGLRIANNYELKILLRHYDISRIQGTFSSEIKVPNFRKIYRVSQILSQTSLKLPIEDLISIELLSMNSNCALNEQYCLGVQKIISKLQQNNYFSEAIQFANVTEIDSKDIVMNEWILKAAVNMNSIEFWYSCWNSVVVADPSLTIAFKIFKKYINQVSSILVKCYLIFKCIEAAFENKIDYSQLEAQLWKCIVDIESDTQTKQQNLVQWSQLWDQIIIFQKINRNDSNFNQIGSNKYANSNSQSLDYVIEKLLNNVCIESANKVALLFGYCSKDLDITLTCYKVANGDIKDLSEVPLGVQLKAKTTNSIVRDLPEKFNYDQKEKIKFLESTCMLVSIGLKACKRILLYYKIACLLDINFSAIDRTKLYDLYLLKCLIASNSFEALNFAKDLIQVNKISEEEVATIMCNYVINKLNTKNTKLHTSSSDVSLFSLEDSAESNFISLLRLLNDTTVLGYKLIKEADENVQKFLFIEILIAAHQCFTISCDVKGIALVLAKTRAFITQNLMQEKDFKSIVRLMSGIGRYSEMTYCFDIIRDYNQFELILTKRIETVPQLRIALLDFLKGDKENYPMVAHRFCLYRQSAENLESSAYELLERLNINNATNLICYKPQLESILHHLDDAETNYKQASCHTHAASCHKMAQLIALQMYYLSKNTILIKLNNDQVSRFIQNGSKFEESLIIAEAYQHHTSWSIAIVNNVIKKNNLNYLSAFNAQIGINNSSLIEEIIQICKKLINDSNHEKLKYESVIRKLIECIDDIEMKFKVAFKLNIMDLANSMINQTYSGAYLRDLRRFGYL